MASPSTIWTLIGSSQAQSAVVEHWQRMHNPASYWEHKTFEKHISRQLKIHEQTKTK
jgi:hypothetical protein